MTENTQATMVNREALPELLDAKQAAQIAGVTPRSISKLCTQGTIKAVKVLSVWRINRDAFYEYLGLAS